MHGGRCTPLLLRALATTGPPEDKAGGRGAFCTNSRPFCYLFAAHPPDENKACAKEAASPVAPRSGRFFSAGGQEVHSKRMEAARKGLGEGANGPAEHTCNASGHCTGLWDNTMVYGHGSRRVVGTSPQLTCCGGIRACGCSSCRLRARCCCHRGCGRQGRGREPIRRRLMSQAFAVSPKKPPRSCF